MLLAKKPTLKIDEVTRISNDGLSNCNVLHIFHYVSEFILLPSYFNVFVGLPFLSSHIVIICFTQLLMCFASDNIYYYLLSLSNA